jgi:hypothetical protein
MQTIALTDIVTVIHRINNFTGNCCDNVSKNKYSSLVSLAAKTNV